MSRLLAGILFIAAGAGGAFLLANLLLGKKTGLAVQERRVANFELFDSAGNAQELFRYSDRRAIVIFAVGSKCRDKNSGMALLNEVRDRFKPRKVAFLALNPSPDESRESIRKLATELGIESPIMRDPSQLVARQLKLREYGAAVVIDTAIWDIVYRGPISGVGQALRAIFRGESPRSRDAEPEGKCPVNFIATKSLEYARDIAPILKSKCLNCHSEAGAIAPFFNSYESVRGWSAMIRETVMTGRMPIWGVDSDPGEFVNDNSLTPEQKRELVQWLDDGAPRSDGPDPLVGYVPKINRIPPEGATYVVSVDEEVEIPPEGFTDYKYFQLGGPLPRDMWVKAVEAVSTNPRAMHHATLTVTPLSIKEYQGMAQSEQLPKEFWLDMAVRTDLRERAKRSPPTNSPYNPDEMIRFGVYSTYARNNLRHTPTGTARFLPKGYHLLLDVHHHGTGKVEKERTTVYFYEIRKTPDIKPIHRLDQIGTKFALPPHKKFYRVNLPTFIADKDIQLLACNAHMHMRGRALHAQAILPDKSIARVLTISSFLYDWHSGMAAIYAKPRTFPKGTRIESYAILDNSATNPFNPNPNLSVRFGQTLDKHEMPKLQCSYVEME